MDRFTISASAASVALVGIAATAAWLPAVGTRPLAEPSLAALNEEAKDTESSWAACLPHHPLEDAGLGISGRLSEFDDLAESSAFNSYAPANYGRASAFNSRPPQEFGWLEAKTSAENASGLAADEFQPALHHARNSESERNSHAVHGETSVAEPMPTTGAAFNELEGRGEYPPVAIEQGEFVSVIAEQVEDLRAEGAIDADGLLSSDALAFFAAMSTEQIEAYSRLAAMIRHPELAEGIVSLANVDAGGLPPLIPPVADDEPEPKQAVLEPPPEWAAFESLNGDVRLLLGGNERTAIKVEQGTVVGALGEVDRIVKGESELAVLFEGGEAILGAALNRPPKAPVLRPAALTRAQR